MAKRKNTGLGTEAFFQETASQQASKPVEQHTSKPARAHAYTRIGAYVLGYKEKGTYYLSAETMERLDEVLPYSRRLVAEMVSKDKRRLVSKSLLVEAALQIVLDDLEENKAESLLAKKLAGL